MRLTRLLTSTGELRSEALGALASLSPAKENVLQLLDQRLSLGKGGGTCVECDERASKRHLCKKCYQRQYYRKSMGDPEKREQLRAKWRRAKLKRKEKRGDRC